MAQLMRQHQLQQLILPHIHTTPLDKSNRILVARLHDVHSYQLHDAQSYPIEHHFAEV